MSDIMTAISDDINEYIWLCEHFKEKPQCDKDGVDPYCEHARKLKARAFAEREKKRKEEERKAKKAKKASQCKKSRSSK